MTLKKYRKDDISCFILMELADQIDSDNDNVIKLILYCSLLTNCSLSYRLLSLTLMVLSPKIDHSVAL